MAAEGFVNGGTWEFDPHAKVSWSELLILDKADTVDAELDDIIAIAK
jgi:hypothetical protein